MAEYTVHKIKHAVLAPNVVDVINLTMHSRSVEVINRGDFDIYFTANGPVPTVGGDDCDIVPVGTALQVYSSQDETIVRLVSIGEVEYTVALR